jgi:hypothetical protein
MTRERYDGPRGGLGNAGKLQEPWTEQRRRALRSMLLWVAACIGPILMVLFVLLTIGSRRACAADAPAAVPDPVTLTVTRATLQTIGAGVMKLPYETAAPVLNDLQAQLNAQDKAAADKAKTPEPAPDPAKDKPKPTK